LSSAVISRGGGLKRFFEFMGWLRNKTDRKRVITGLIIKIEASAQEIRESITKLEIRYRNLFKRAVSSYLKGERDRSLIYINEAKQVEKMYTKLMVVDKVLEQVKLRLETIENVSNLTASVLETTNILSVARDYIKDVVPAMGYSIDSLVRETKKVLAETTDSVDMNTESALEYSPEAVKMLKELEKTVAETVKTRLPEIPSSLIPSSKTKGLEIRVKENAMKVATLRKPRLRRLKPEEIDKNVLEYVLTHGGFIDVSDAAAKLGVNKADIMESLHRLKEQNKIIF